MITRLLATVICLAWLIPGPAQAQTTPQELAAKVQARYQSIHSLKADYHRLSRFQAAAGQPGRVVEGKGKLTWARPLSLRLLQLEPRRELVVTTSQGVWWSRPRLHRADLYPLEQFTSGLRSLLDALGGLASLEQSFILEEPDPEEKTLGQGGPVLVLKPKQSRVDLKRLAIWFSPDLVLKGFRIMSLMGDLTEYRLSQVKINPPLAPETFSFIPDPSFTIRDHRRTGRDPGQHDQAAPRAIVLDRIGMRGNGTDLSKSPGVARRQLVECTGALEQVAFGHDFTRRPLQTHELRPREICRVADRQPKPAAVVSDIEDGMTVDFENVWDNGDVVRHLLEGSRRFDAHQGKVGGEPVITHSL